MANDNISILPAYKDLSLKNRAGELWEDIVGYEGYYQVSNFGRIKSLTREINTGFGKSIYAERIKRLAVFSAANKAHKDLTFQLIVFLMIDKKNRSYTIRRLVYYHFIAPFDLNNKFLNVLTKNGNGFDIHPKNLILTTVKRKVQRSVTTGRMLNTFEHVDHNKSIAHSTQVTSKKVSQYDTSGNRIETFLSIHEAARITKIHVNNISGAVNGRENTAGSYYWRSGDVPTINIALLKQQKAEHRRLVTGTKVTQYNLEGKPIAYFNNLKDAAKTANCIYTSISAAIRGINKTAGGFRWKKGHHTEPLLSQ